MIVETRPTSKEQRRAERRTEQRRRVQQQRQAFSIALHAIAVSSTDDADRLRAIARDALEQVAA